MISNFELDTPAFFGQRVISWIFCRVKGGPFEKKKKYIPQKREHNAVKIKAVAADEVGLLS